jgi:putative nucleotidyltransferase with HDIG domain
MNLELIDNIKTAHLLGEITALRDHETSMHSIEVAYLSSLLGEKLELCRDEIQSLMKGAYVHDLGKVGIPDKILLKESSFTEDEWIVMRKHPKLGADLLKDIDWYKKSIDVVLYHHEKYDGSGYPKGLKGKEIPYLARIFTIIDVFDALARKRPYKKAFDFDKIMLIMKEETGLHFDPDIMKCFLPLAKEFFQILSKGKEADLKKKLEQRRIEIFGI